MEHPDDPGMAPPLIGLALVNTLGVLLAGMAVAAGVTTGTLKTEPAVVGLIVLVVGAGIGTYLGAARPGETTPSVHGSLALGLVSALLGLAFLFGPTSVVIVAGAPLVSVVTTRLLGRRWGAGVLLYGFTGASALFAAAVLGVLPNRPAFAATGEPDLVIGCMQLAILVLASGLVVAMPQGAAPAPTPEPTRPPTPVPAPEPAPGPARTGSFTAEQLQRITLSDRYSADELAAARQSLGDPDPEIASHPDYESTLEAQKLESLGVLAGGIAHDFNNLLMSILGNSSIALMEADEESTVLQPLREIEIAAKRARDLVGQLLAYAGKGTIAATPIDLNGLVHEMGELLATGSRRVTVEYDFCTEVPLIVADPTQIRQIAMNLITNGADAMAGRDGRIRVTTQIEHLDRIDLDKTLLGLGCQEGAYVLFSVADEGCGMDATTLARIFDPFYTTKKTGRGLGLAAVLGIVRRAGGTMAVESEVDRGTTFRIHFPYAEAVDEDEDLPTEHTSTAQGWAASQSGAILVVDDDPVVLRVTTRMIERLDFEVLEAYDGERALEVFDAERERIVATVLDMTMPGMDGVEVLAKIKERDADARVILTSGYSEADIPKTETVFIQKPYTMKQLTKALDKVLE